MDQRLDPLQLLKNFSQFNTVSSSNHSSFEISDNICITFFQIDTILSKKIVKSLEGAQSGYYRKS